jgi:hypothetical protein
MLHFLLYLAILMDDYLIPSLHGHRGYTRSLSYDSLLLIFHDSLATWVR